MPSQACSRIECHSMWNILMFISTNSFVMVRSTNCTLSKYLGIVFNYNGSFKDAIEKISNSEIKGRYKGLEMNKRFLPYVLIIALGIIIIFC